MKYQQKSFMVPVSGKQTSADCRHGWIDQKGDCVLCGAKKVMNRATRKPSTTAEHSMSGHEA